jgi:Tfp pilus assembly protein PilF
MPAEPPVPTAVEPLPAPVVRRWFAVPHWRELLLCLLLAAATAGVYARACRNGFVNYDDDRYVEHNPQVRQGLTLDNVRWAFTTTEMVNWHPLTWLSFELDAQVFRLNPGGFHLVNVVLHVLNTLLLFAVLRGLTGAAWRSGFVAALFALHPLHVESVAWISERKDTLSTLFWMLTMAAYAGYARRPGVLRYLLVLVPFVLGLLSKSMLVTLPFVLLLLDYWPLGRVRRAAGPLLRLVLEKVPLLVLAAASCYFTLDAQHRGGEANPLSQLPVRLESAAVYYVGYLSLTFWPHGLIPFHAVATHAPPLWQPVGAVALLGALTVCCVLLARLAPYLLVGWLWFVGTLVPVIGVVQVIGGHGMADRYTYVPLIGLFIVLVWGVADLASRLQVPAWVVGPAGVVVLAWCAVLTFVQIGYWYDSTALWTHALDVEPDNYLANNNLAAVLLVEGKPDEALRHLRESERVAPWYALAHYNLGYGLSMKGKTREAIAEYYRAVQLDPHYADAHNNLGVLLLEQGDAEGAERAFALALENGIYPALGHNNRGRARYRLGKLDEAVADFREAVRLAPGDADARTNLGEGLFFQGHVDEAIAQFEEAVRLAPNLGRARACLDDARRAARKKTSAP